MCANSAALVLSVVETGFKQCTMVELSKRPGRQQLGPREGEDIVEDGVGLENGLLILLFELDVPLASVSLSKGS